MRHAYVPQNPGKYNLKMENPGTTKPPRALPMPYLFCICFYETQNKRNDYEEKAVFKNGKNVQTACNDPGYHQVSLPAAYNYVDAGKQHVDAVRQHVDAGRQHVDAGKQHVDAVRQHVDAGRQHVDAGRQHVDVRLACRQHEDTDYSNMYSNLESSKMPTGNT
jgi:hypothetical protein